MNMLPRIAIPHAHSSKPEYAARVMPQYRQAIELAGGVPVEFALDLEAPQIARLASTCDAVLLPGSRADVNPEKYGAPRDPLCAESDPLRDNVDELLLQDAYNMRKPVLGICYGMQSLNVWRTGTLVQHLTTPVTHSGGDTPAPPHRVVIDSMSRLAEIVREGLAFASREMGLHPEHSDGAAFLELKVNSSHHQAALKPGDGLKPVAWCPDDQVIEAVEGTAPEHWVLAVQWHPERMLEDVSAQAIFLAFIEAAKERHRSPRTGGVDFESMIK